LLEGLLDFLSGPSTWRVLLACICQRIVGQIGLPIPPPTLWAPGVTAVSRINGSVL
jgi:hypothetical protein